MGGPLIISPSFAGGVCDPRVKGLICIQIGITRAQTSSRFCDFLIKRTIKKKAQQMVEDILIPLSTEINGTPLVNSTDPSGIAPQDFAPGLPGWTPGLRNRMFHV
ncbi:unnamed protein product [Caretta caretta]